MWQGLPLDRKLTENCGMGTGDLEETSLPEGFHESPTLIGLELQASCPWTPSLAGCRVIGTGSGSPCVLGTPHCETPAVVPFIGVVGMWSKSHVETDCFKAHPGCGPERASGWAGRRVPGAPGPNPCPLDGFNRTT